MCADDCREFLERPVVRGMLLLYPLKDRPVFENVMRGRDERCRLLGAGNE